jgi:hypothetical protein
MQNIVQRLATFQARQRIVEDRIQRISFHPQHLYRESKPGAELPVLDVAVL